MLKKDEKKATKGQNTDKKAFAKAGHMCMVCGFRASTKNKYRELQDHLVRQHFQDRIKAALPTRRPFVCPDAGCSVEGKDWQALMRHYTGKHGILESYLKEVIANGLVNKAYRENVKKPRISALNPVLDDYQDKENSKRTRTTKKRKKRPSDASSTESSSSGENNSDLLVEGNNNKILSGTVFNQEPPCGMALSPGTRTIIPTEIQDHVVEVDNTDIAENPTHLALVLKRQKLDTNGFEMPPEETYAFVDLKYFMPVSANKYIFKGSCIDDPDMGFCTPTAASQGTDMLDNPQVQYTIPPPPQAQPVVVPPNQEYPHLYQPNPNISGQQGCPDNYLDTGYADNTYYAPTGSDQLQFQPNTIIIPPDSIVAPCSAVSPSLTIPSHDQIPSMSNTTVANLQVPQSMNDQMVVRNDCGSMEQAQPGSFITRTLTSPETRQIDLGQIVRQTIHTPVSGDADSNQPYIIHNDISTIGSQSTQPSDNQQQAVYTLGPMAPYSAQMQTIPTASAEAAEAAVSGNLITTQMPPQNPPGLITTIPAPTTVTTTTSIPEQNVVSIPNVEPIPQPTPESGKVLVEEAKTINIEGMNLIPAISGEEVASTVTVVSEETVPQQSPSCSEPSSEVPKTCAEATMSSSSTKESSNGIKEIAFSLF